MEEQINKSYYAIIPAPVRYDKELLPNAKLLYGEITALCNEKGFCWANNEYFSQLYGVSEVSISKWVNALIKKNYIASEIKYEDGKTHRHLTIVYDGLKEKFNTPLKEKFKHNNTSNNITKNIKENYIKESCDETLAFTVEDLELWFNKTYEIYPRKISKVQAKITYEHKLRGLNKDEAKNKANKIYMLLKRQIEVWVNENDGQGRKFEHTPYFSSWLSANIDDSPHYRRTRK